jgi:dTDP-glucose 4,6-dehydratase/UDP-glucose 4-epimerase
VFGDGLQLRDFNYVDDVVDAMLLAAESDQANGEIYNLGSSEVINLKSLAELMIQLRPETTLNVVPFPPERKAIDIGDYYSDFSKIKADLGWQPAVDIRRGVEKSIEYYEENYKHYWEMS